MVYLYHFLWRYRHAQHYLGATERPLLDRHKEHISGRGSPLVYAAWKAGIPMKLIPLYPNESYGLERAIKWQKNSRRICPLCNRQHRRTELKS